LDSIDKIRISIEFIITLLNIEFISHFSKLICHSLFLPFLFKNSSVIIFREKENITSGFAIISMCIMHMQFIMQFIVLCQLCAVLGHRGGLHLRLISVSSRSGRAIHADWLDIDLAPHCVYRDDDLLLSLSLSLHYWLDCCLFLINLLLVQF